jgi:hypothetical protein
MRYFQGEADNSRIPLILFRARFHVVQKAASGAADIARSPVSNHKKTPAGGKREPQLLNVEALHPKGLKTNI